MEDVKLESVACVLGETVDAVGWKAEVCSVAAELGLSEVEASDSVVEG